MRTTQNALILQQLKKRSRTGITQLDAIGFGVWRLAARIYELRQLGYQIETQRVEVSGHPARYILRG